MTDRHTASRNRSAVDMSSVVPWSNVSGETIPAYGVVQLRTDYTTISRASKPNSTSGLFFVNGLVSVAAAAKGESRVWNLPQAVLLSGSPQVGDEVGPVSGQWYMSRDGVGFRVLLQANESGVGVVTMVGGGGAESGHIWFEIESVVCNDDNSKTLFATPTWYSGGCDNDIPGLDEYGQVAIEDPCSILEYYTAEWLESGGVVGRATYMYPRDASYCEPAWLVDQICGQPECA